jgi:oligopeptide/dipeptide ABC transporter ATP-binding protein
VSAPGLLEVRELTTVFATEHGDLIALDGVSFDVGRAEIVGVVGESGSGKTLTALSIMRLIDHPGRVASGSVRLLGEELLDKSEREMRSVRGGRIGMVWQDPMASLNPVKTVGAQIADALLLHADRRLGRKEVRARVVAAMDSVHIPDSDRRVDEYPHQLSGGLQQRVMIAMALIAEPDLLIADEPTTALDVTIQLQILDLLRELRREQGMGILLITHDLGVVAETCDRVQVMYGGRIVESADTGSLFNDASHPYTKGLLESMPRRTTRKGELRAIRGTVPDLEQRPAGCAFHPRCTHVMDVCRSDVPTPVERTPTHAVSCHLTADPEWSAQ